MSGECEKCGEHCLDCQCGKQILGCAPKKARFVCSDLPFDGKYESIPVDQGSLIDHPHHYKGKRFEAIDVIEDFELNFNLGNVIKYILRSYKKENYLQDLKKAHWYLQREIDYHEN